jgi:hypothetical protein
MFRPFKQVFCSTQVAFALFRRHGVADFKAMLQHGFLTVQPDLRRLGHVCGDLGRQRTGLSHQILELGIFRGNEPATFHAL